MIEHLFDGHEGGFWCYHDMPNGQQCGEERIKHTPPPFDHIFTATGCELDHLAWFYFDHVKRLFQEPDDYFRNRLLLCAGLVPQA